ncbi:hypothetical protein A2130_03205 [Candidatus Woesebacteria bacterium GWC2_33_12]|uniref:Nucleotidyl transferase AbiEii/AbiGii toxin family protein n=1 Tax=Candidatus Woesebacteria bacterium GW2011_GWB1_33_22 TaxID=1618566 RepID=A0A0G0C0D1_9BACT|nr:MAG: hypothetical protein UR29_C0004G0006 [Candidatus Woesebacteria bacterium GW2011_GWC2_33_12]KKP41968.1 MAG: hypothetical protein UR33_C0007G0031 [Candidatus Woesebacteria bacterium GW2011_GWA2_33_20]KKP44595.1 MAG: hypothetical protein UR35_C0007G0011 [Candidatus Woesebacteria bacterium GW2011_GWB1_33_22]KKP46399.1 MAG: hypothetical protein UR37_C0008G0011 [Microgenomates group bacterium GW2011_GWC1_33_28]KKP50453.1 MAG: hypothetical protein UR41_C0007G0011 [Candidatus Woesebacteria bact
MITKDQIKYLSKSFKIDEYSIFREYLQLTFLSYLYQERTANKLFFKGGTALRLIFGSPRFSEDLDFSTSCSNSEIINLLKSIENKISKELPNLIIKPFYKGTEGIRFRIIFSQKEFRYPFSIRLDFHQQKKVLGTKVSTLNTQFPIMIFPQIYHLSGESILLEKFDALKNRNKGRDIFDIWFLLSKSIKIIDIKKSDIENLEKFPQKSLEKDLGQFLPRSQKQIIAVLKTEISKLLKTV